MRRKLLGLVLAGLVAVLSGGSVAVAHTSSLTIDPDATLSPGGTVITVRGTVTCTLGEFFRIQVRVFQGRGVNQESASGVSPPFGAVFTPCSGSPQLWEVEALSSTGAFREGKANASATSATSVSPNGFPVDAEKSVGRVIELSSS
jgi:hypothetical protein